MHRLLFAGLLCLSLPACAWVTLEDDAKDVLVLPENRLGAECESQGKVKVSVADRVGVLERHEDEVVEDLHILARNHAAGAGGDTVVALGPVENGAREYEVWQCTEEEGRTDARRDSDEVEVIPYDGDN